MSKLETSTGDERSLVMSRPADLVPTLARPGTAVHRAGDAVAGIVGDSVLGSADVARTRERRRLTRLRRLVAVSALALGWVVIREMTGHGIFPSVHLPHGLGTALPIILIVLMLGAVMAAPFL